MSKIIFIIFVILLGIQRLWELRLSRRNEARILAQGGREHAPGHFRVMKLLHTTWFAAMIIEVLWLARPFYPWLAAGAFLIFSLGQALRYAAIRTLGKRWTVRIMTLPAAPLVDRGIYRYVRHPNYLGVILELAAVPLIHSAYLTAIFFTLANAWLLKIRIQAEERALSLDNSYERVLGHRPRFIPQRESAWVEEVTERQVSR